MLLSERSAVQLVKSGMGTKVQCESYLLGYPSVRNLKEDSSSSWSPYYEDKALHEHLYSSFMLRPVNEYSGYDREMLKRTMLEHEAIFRKQVCELHRLYRIQRDLMDDLRMKELCKFPMHGGRLQSFLFSPTIVPETTGNIWQMPHLIEANMGFNEAAAADFEDVKPSLDLLKHMQSTQIPRQNGASSKDGGLSSFTMKSHPRQMLDLQLPADVYIDIEDSDRIENEDIVARSSRVTDSSNIIRDLELENDVKLTLGSREGCSNGSANSNPIWQDGQYTRRLDYLGEFKNGLSWERQPDSLSSDFLCVQTTHEEAHGHQLPTASNKNFLPKEFFADRHKDEGPCSNIFDGDKGKSALELPSFSSKSGSSGNRVNLFSPGLYGEKCPMLSKPSKLKVKREHSFPSYDYGEMQTWFEEKPTLGISPYAKRFPFVDSNNSEQTNSDVTGSFSVIPCSDYMSSEAPLVMSKRKPPPRVITHVPIAIQALPCFPASEMTNPRGRKPRGLGRSFANKFSYDGDLKSHLRAGLETSPTQNGFCQDLWSDSNSAVQIKHSSDRLISEQSETCASQKCPKLYNGVSSSPVLPGSTREDGRLEESSGGPWLGTKPLCTNSLASFSQGCNQQTENFPSLSQVKEGRKKKRSRTLHSVGMKNVLGFSVKGEFQQNVTNRLANVIKTEVPNLGTVAGKGIRETGIDLNAVEILTEEEVQIINSKIIHEIDLEAPYGTLDSLAAENLIVMSLGSAEQLAAASCDSLRWFADVVSSEAANHVNNDDEIGMDVFESLTLQLEEMKPDEYLSQPLEPEDGNNEVEAGTVSLLLTRTRRGLLRKRRQKKDFQKDILPGLVSLSKHQVTEDLQAFDCLMRAMGEDWQCNLTRRITGRKSFNGQGRGRRRPKNLTVSVTEKISNSQCTEAEHNSNVQVEINERSIIGWGRTTRRGRRPRVRPGSAALLLS